MATPALVDIILRRAKTAEAKSLDDVSDQVKGQRDESFIKPEVLDAPPRSIADNEVPTATNATDKVAPVQETLKAAVKDATPSSSPQGGNGNQGNLKDEEKRDNLAESVADAVPKPAPVQTAVVTETKPDPVPPLTLRPAPTPVEPEKAPEPPPAPAAVEPEKAPEPPPEPEKPDDLAAVDQVKASLERILAAKPKIDAVTALMDDLAKACTVEKTAGWGTAALAGLGVGALGLGVGSGIASPEQAAATRQWIAESDRDDEEDRGRDWASDLPDFAGRAHRYALYGSRAISPRLFGLGVPGMMGKIHDVAQQLNRADLTDHYRNFQKGPVTGYVQMLRERDRWADAAGLPSNQFHIAGGDKFYADKPIIFGGQRRKGVSFNNDLRKAVLHRIATEATAHPVMKKRLVEMGLGDLPPAQLAAELERQNIVETPKVVGREDAAPVPIANEIMRHADMYAMDTFGKGLDKLDNKQQEALFEGLNNYIVNVDPKLWLRKRYIDNQIGYWSPAPLKMYGQNLIKPLNTVRNLSLLGGLAGTALGIGAGAKWLYDKGAGSVKKTAAVDIIPGGEADGKSDAMFKPEDLAKGVAVEEEHTTSPQLAKEIAKDHLAESPKYYRELAKMEEKLETDDDAEKGELKKNAEIDILTGAPGAGKTTAAKKNRKAYDVVLHGDLPMKLTNEKRRAMVVARIREAMRSHNTGKRVLVDSAPRQLDREYGPLKRSARRIIVLDVPNDVAAAGFAKRTKSSPEKAMRVVETAGPSLTDLRSDPRYLGVDRDTVGEALRKIAAFRLPSLRVNGPSAGSLIGTGRGVGATARQAVSPLRLGADVAMGQVLNTAVPILGPMRFARDAYKRARYGGTRVRNGKLNVVPTYSNSAVTNLLIPTLTTTGIGVGQRIGENLKTAAHRPFRRRVEVIVTDGLYVFGVEKPFSEGGVWFPGGGVEGPEEKFADAAVREAKEETGIEVDEIQRLAAIDPVHCRWSEKVCKSSQHWEGKSKNWCGDRTYLYVATARRKGKATGNDPLKGDWIPIRRALNRLFASLPFDNEGWKPLTKARYQAVLELAPKLRAAPRAA